MADEDVVRSLVEHNRITAVINTLFLATDARDWERVKGCFAPAVTFDMTSLAGGAPQRLSPEQIVTGWQAGLAPIDAVHHQVGNLAVACTGTDATASCYGIAYPTPATNRYPVINSPPSVSFTPGTEIPDTSFPVASFNWAGTDPDGDNTIKFYYWALNDTSTWHSVSSNTTLITLRQADGIVQNANNVLYIKAEDIAGTFSTVKRMPATSKTWFLRPKAGQYYLN